MLVNHVQKLLDRATSTPEALHAMQLSQAALNAAHTIQVLVQAGGLKVDQGQKQ